MKHAAHAAKKERFKHLKPEVRRVFMTGRSLTELASAYHLNLDEVARLLNGLPDVPKLAYHNPEHLRLGVAEHGGLRSYSSFHNFSEGAVRQYAIRKGIVLPRPKTA